MLSHAKLRSADFGLASSGVEGEGHVEPFSGELLPHEARLETRSVSESKKTHMFCNAGISALLR